MGPSHDPQEEHLHSVADELANVGGAEVVTAPLMASPVLAPETVGGWSPAARGGATHTSPTVEAAQDLLTSFRLLLEASQLDLDASTMVDVLSAYLSSQFILFAGPSGTGKSVTARAVASLFCTENSFAVIEGRRQLIGPEDVAGYFSPLSQDYVRVPDLKALRQLAVPAGDASPALLVEEINLSTIEGYLAPFTHGLSGPSTEAVAWPLHDTGIPDPPQRLVMEPFPRLLGTINVDSTAIAPAPKVTARACVVLLEPAETPDLSAALSQLTTATSSIDALRGAGAALVGDPLEILSSGIADQAALQSALGDLFDLLRGAGTYAGSGGGTAGQTRNPIARRQIAQSLIYSSWFVLLAQAFEANGGTIHGEPHRLGAENAVLHFVLPSLPASDFGLALQRLDVGRANLGPPTPGGDGLSGVLLARVDRLMSTGAEGFGSSRILDFWDRLS